MRANTELALRASRGDFGMRAHLLDLPLTRIGEALWWQAECGPMRAEQLRLNGSRVFALTHCRYPRKLRYRDFHKPAREFIWRRACG